MKKTLIKFYNLFPHDIARLAPLLFVLIFMGIIFNYKFSFLDSAIYDVLIRNDLLSNTKSDVVAVTYDEKTDEVIGDKTPYSFTTQIKFLEKVLQNHPRAVVLITPFSEISDTEEVRFNELISNYIASGGIFKISLDSDIYHEGAIVDTILHWGYYSTGLSDYLLNQTANKVVRKVPLTKGGEYTLQYMLAKDLFDRDKIEKDWNLNDVKGAIHNEIQHNDYAYYRYSNTNIPQIPYHNVISGTLSSDVFTDKIVVVGPTYITNDNDFAYTPFEKEQLSTPKILILAQMIDALVKGNTVYLAPMYLSYILSVVIGLFILYVLMKHNPQKTLKCVFIIFTALVVVTYFFFTVFSVWIPSIHIFIVVGGAFYIGIPFKAIDEYRRRFAFQEEAKLLRKVEKLKANFISLMSHDLKTPVAKIAGAADTLRRENADNPEVTKGLSSIIDSTVELNNFISSILDLAKVESMDVKLDKTSEDINEILETVIGRKKQAIHQANMKLETNLSPLFPITVDAKLMTRVFSNIIGNAIKYAGNGQSIFVETTDDQDWVYISIRDTGPGIPKEDLDHIFDKFYRVKNDANHSIKGSGLGLYLVKYFIELQGGGIVAESKLGEGTEFKIKLKNA